LAHGIFRKRKSKGSPKTGGRKPGSKNRFTFTLGAIVTICEKFGYDPLERLIKLSEDPALELKEQARIHIALLPYVRGKPKEIEVEDKTNSPLIDIPAEKLIELLPTSNDNGQTVFKIDE
jgi:hypothetical protein